MPELRSAVKLRAIHYFQTCTKSSTRDQLAYGSAHPKQYGEIRPLSCLPSRHYWLSNALKSQHRKTQVLELSNYQSIKQFSWSQSDSRMVFYKEPTYPVIDPSPDTKRCLANFRTGEYLSLLGLTAGGFAMGWLLSRRQFRGFNSGALSIMGFCAGMFSGVEVSAQRLGGFKPNDAEVAEYGAIPEELLKGTEKRRLQKNRYMVDYFTAELSYKPHVPRVLEEDVVSYDKKFTKEPKTA